MNITGTSRGSWQTEANPEPRGGALSRFHAETSFEFNKNFEHPEAK